ncbi:PilZ domain-containing protein [Candidatus Enterovibrio escicola]|uniref:PilZ domain-containing protein n=2 Tax=Candidatus Enterovibrio escicola TaxID=1927127 RepID=UPI001237F750|nr:PilZ domain-containing protein [Candidatus Enterovibrio escacola]
MMERRKFFRIVFRVPATIRQGCISWSSRIFDLSLKGALLEVPIDWKLGNEDDYSIQFQLNESDIYIDMDLKLIKECGKYLRFKIDHIDIDSASHLKRLIELNVGNDVLLHRELAQLTDMKDIL